jgi:hypothetical protein
MKRMMGKWNNYSKTDTDAMKKDHMGNGQLRPGYNVQIGTGNGDWEASPKQS